MLLSVLKEKARKDVWRVIYPVGNKNVTIFSLSFRQPRLTFGTLGSGQLW